MNIEELIKRHEKLNNLLLQLRITRAELNEILLKKNVYPFDINGNPLVDLTFGEWLGRYVADVITKGNKYTVKDEKGEEGDFRDFLYFRDTEFVEANRYVEFVYQKKDKGYAFNSDLAVQFFIKFIDLIYDEKADAFFVYNENIGLWEEISERDIKKLITKFDFFTNRVIEMEIIGKMKNEAKQPLEFDLEQKPKNLIFLKNGIYDIQTKTFRRYKREDFVKKDNVLAVRYDENARVDEVDKFFTEISDSEQMKELLYEIFSYLLFRENKHAKAFLLVGSGANGKSTYLNLIKEFLGEQNITAIPLQQIEFNKFTIYNFKDKYANVFGDLPYTSLPSLSIFKGLVSGDFVSAEKKFKQKRLVFKPFLKLLFATNKLPKFGDDSDAVFRRLIIIRFRKSFLENADKDKINKISTPQELSGLLNEALKRLDKVLNEGFSYTFTLDQIREEYENNSDSILYFINECVEEAEETNEYVKEMVYNAYVKFCDEKKVIKETKMTFLRGKNAFVEKMTRKGFRISEKRIAIDKVKYSIFQGYFTIKGVRSINEEDEMNNDEMQFSEQQTLFKNDEADGGEYATF